MTTMSLSFSSFLWGSNQHINECHECHLLYPSKRKISLLATGTPKPSFSVNVSLKSKILNFLLTTLAKIPNYQNYILTVILVLRIFQIVIVIYCHRNTVSGREEIKGLEFWSHNILHASHYVQMREKYRIKLSFSPKGDVCGLGKTTASSTRIEGIFISFKFHLR